MFAVADTNVFPRLFGPKTPAVDFMDQDAAQKITGDFFSSSDVKGSL